MTTQTTIQQFTTWANNQPDENCRRWSYEIEALNMGSIASDLDRIGFTTHNDGSVSEQECECECDSCAHSCDCDYCDRADYGDHCEECGTNEISPADFKPCLTTKDGGRLIETRNLFNRANVYTDDTCGGHIHINATDISPRDAVNMVKIWRKVETLFPEIIGRTETNFAEPNTDHDIANLEDGSFHSLERYRALNFTNIRNFWEDNRHTHKSTIEFRQFAGTANIDLIIASGYLCRAIADTAKQTASLYWVYRSQTAEELLKALGLGLAPQAL